MSRNSKFSKVNTSVEGENTSFKDTWYKKVIDQLPTIVTTVLLTTFAAGATSSKYIGEFSKMKEDLALLSSLPDEVASLRSSTLIGEKSSQQIKESEERIRKGEMEIMRLWAADDNNETKFVLRKDYNRDLKEINKSIKNLEVAAGGFSAIEKYLNQIDESMKNDIKDIKSRLLTLNGESN